MSRVNLVSAFAAIAFFPATAFAQAQSVDLGQFDGRWFEIERNHNDVQQDCSSVQIDFTPRHVIDRYAIAMACTRQDDGQIETLRVDARVINPGTNAKFRFRPSGLPSVGRLVGRYYWVWDHAPDYSWAIMGLPDKSNWWVWHRDQNAPEAERDHILARVSALGFSTDSLVHTGL